MKKKDFPLLDAIKDLDRELGKHGVEPFELRVVGDFALLLNDIRKGKNAYTGIEFVGDDLKGLTKDIVKEVGLKHHFGSGWINNDFLLAGSNLEDLEFSVGKLHFHNALSLPNIKIKSLDMMDLLRMKAILIDTEVSALDYGGDFTRVTDLNDMVLLAKNQDVDLTEYLSELEDQGYIIDDKTSALILDYEKTGECHFEKIVRETRAGILHDFEKPDMENENDMDELINALGQMG